MGDLKNQPVITVEEVMKPNGAAMEFTRGDTKYEPGLAVQELAEPRIFRYYDVLMVISATVAVCSNLLALKVVSIGLLTFGGSVVFFPISYILGDVLTEVYGFKRARRVIWVAFGAMVFAAFMTWVVLMMPSAADGGSQAMSDHFQAVFSTTPRIIFASLLGFLVGDFVNTIVLAVLKVKDQGRQFWKRAVASTVIGQAADSIVFYPLAFAGTWSWDLLWTILITHYIIKVTLEVVLLPVTYRVVKYLKRTEGIDHYDTHTKFTPFGVEV